ncbi:MAG: carboxypeptidase regulatory-like domain-containing protein [Planctomycetes bacterium]|nr:carboxypeptidase regulatory-like domain-containing protein [Planctomycetota bacterium]
MRSAGGKVIMGAVAGVVVVVLLLLLNANVNAPAPHDEAGNTPLTNKPQNKGNEPDHPSNTPQDPPPDDPPPDVPEDPPEVVLEPLPGPKIEVQVKVRVLTPAGSPVSGATVSLRAMPRGHQFEEDWFEPPELVELKSGTTDGAGEAQFDVYIGTDSNGERMLQAHAAAQGYAPGRSATTLLNVHNHTCLLTLRLHAECAILGRVVDSAGNGVSGARVNAYVFGASTTLPWASTDSGQDGRFRIDNMPATAGIIGARAAGFAQAWPWNYRYTPIPPEHDVGDLVLQATGGVTGRVLDPSGNPLPGAHVFVRPTDTLFGGEDTAQTDADGRFTIAELRHGAGTYRLAVCHAKFARALLEEFDVASGQVTDVGDQRVTAGATLTVKVTHERDAPLGGALVRVLYRGAHSELGHAWMRQRGQATTGADGIARLVGMDAGSWSLKVSAAGFASHRAELEMAGDLEHPVRLAAGSTVEGKLLTHERLPAAGALVGLISSDSSSYEKLKDGTLALTGVDWPPRTAVPAVRTDAQGMFVMNDVAPGAYLLAAVDFEGRASLVDGSVNVPPLSVLDLGELTFPALSRLLVEVTDDGVPQAGLELRIVKDSTHQVATTDSAGVALFPDLQPGAWLVMTGDEDLAPSLPEADARRVQVVEGRDVQFKLELPGPGRSRVVGRLSVNSRHVFHRVVLEREGARYWADVGDDGRFEIGSVLHGAYELKAYQASRVEAALPVQVGPDDGIAEINLDFSGGSVSGRVEGGNAESVVLLQKIDAESSHFRAETKCDANGVFDFSGVPAGRWRLGVAGTSGAAHVDIDVGAVDVTDVVLQPAPAGSLVVIVAKLIGNPGTNMFVARLRDSQGHLILPGDGVFPSEGARVVIEGIEPGDYTLEFTGMGYASRYAPVSIKAGERTEVSLELPAAATATIELSGEGLDATAVAQAAVEWLDSAGKPIRVPYWQGKPRQKSALELEVPGLMPEVKQVVLTVPGYKPATLTIDFKPGAKLSLKYQLSPAVEPE